MTETRKTTELGKKLRKLRIDRDETLLDMAERVGQSSAFVSAVEFGKKPAPESFVAAVIRAYGLDDETAQELRSAADRSRASITIRAKEPEMRDLAGMLARKIDTLTFDQVQDIQRILKKGT